MKNMKIFITGYMGAGKSTMLKNQAFDGYARYDLDDVIEEKFGSISAIFNDFGEDHFRGLERDTLMDLVNRDENAVIALGGGTINMDLIARVHERGWIIIFIDTPLDISLERIAGSDRPLKDDHKERYLARLPLYKLADVTIVDFEFFTDLAQKLDEALHCRS